MNIITNDDAPFSCLKRRCPYVINTDNKLYVFEWHRNSGGLHLPNVYQNMNTEFYPSANLGQFRRMVHNLNLLHTV